MSSGSNNDDDSTFGSEPVSGLDFERLQAFMAEQMRWSSLSVSLEEISQENPELVGDLAEFERSSAVSLIAGLFTLPEYQSNCIRLELLLALAVLHCAGKHRADNADVARWFDRLESSRCTNGEDPAEDVFVSRVTDGERDYRVIEGTWESAGAYTQRVLDVALSMPDQGPFTQVKRSVLALLTLSDAVCERAGLRRYQFGAPYPKASMAADELPPAEALRQRTRFEFGLLDDLAISPDDLAPFLFDPQGRSKLVEQQVGASELDAHPLMILDERAVVMVSVTAVTVAVRDFILAFVLAHDLADAFDARLAASFAAAITNAPVLGKISRVPVAWKTLPGGHRVASVGTEVDAGHFLSFQFVLPSCQVHFPGGFKSLYEEDEALAEFLERDIEKSAKYCSSLPGFKRGLTLRVNCGWGKGYFSATEHPLPENWGFESISAPDLLRLGVLDGVTPLYFWRIQDALGAAEAAGLYIENINGILNAIGWIRANHGHVVPHGDLPRDRISPERPFRLMPPSNLLCDLRVAADSGWDQHTLTDAVGRAHAVQRVAAKTLFPSESSRRLYASISDVDQGVLTSIYEGRHTLWLSVTAPAFSRDTHYRVWEMAVEWLHRVGATLDAMDIPVASVPPWVRLEFQDREVERAPPGEVDVSGLNRLWQFTVDAETGDRQVVFLSGFLDGFCVPENVAEAIVVRAMLHAFLHGLTDDAGVLEHAHRRIVLNRTARQFHVLHAQRFADYVRDSLPRDFVAAEPLDDASVRLGLGWRALPIDHDGNLEGKSACLGFLHKIVRMLSEDVIAGLRPYARTAMVTRLVGNHEKASAKEAHWVRTSAAVLGLHGDGPDVMQAIVEKMSELAGASISSRVLAEMALCASPAEGESDIPELDLRKLLARTALMIHLGGVTNAIRFNALPPSIRVSALGDVLVEDDFGQFVVAPTLSRMTRERYTAAAPHQHKNYSPPALTGDIESRLAPAFQQAWVAETGLDLDQIRHIITTLEDKGIADKTAILHLQRSDYLQVLAAAGIPADLAQRFLDQFALVTRPQWEVPPEGFAIKDIMPWRFGRRLSFVSRPILVLDAFDDPAMLIAPDSLRRGVAQVVSAAYRGRLEQDFFRSPEMRNAWLGQASRGHEFNAEVAAALEAAGWTVRSNLGLPELLQRKLPRNYGDVDVLAYRKDRNDVLIIECKDLSPARNYSEVAALLSEYQGRDRDGKPDKLKRHLDRLWVLDQEPEAMSRFTGLEEPNLCGWLVCSGVVPMQFAKTIPTQITVGDVTEVLTKHPAP